MNITELAYIICQDKENMVKLSRKELKEYLGSICEKKKNMIKSNNENLRTLKNEIYNQPLKEWQCDIIWEYIWGDITFEEVKKIFKMDE